jgi:hypothetical protein
MRKETKPGDHEARKLKRGRIGAFAYVLADRGTVL